MFSWQRECAIALAVMHEATITATRTYFPNRRGVANFLEMF